MTREEIDKKRCEQTMSAHGKAIGLEKILFRMNNISATKHGGLEMGEELGISAHLIEDSPYSAIENNLYEFEKIHSSRGKEINNFLSKYDEIAMYSIKEILSIVDGEIFREKYEVDERTNISNGEEYFEQMMDDLKAIIT